MDKSALKKVIKPLIKECLKEVLVEEGLIKVINESRVSQQTLPENKPVIKKLQQESVQQKRVSQDQFKKSVTFAGFNPFEGTNSIDEMEEKSEEGLNINSFINENMDSWNQQLNMIERKKA